MSDITEFIAITIAEARIRKAREALRPRLLQRAQLEGGRLVEDNEGVMEELVDCPVCSGTDVNLGAIPVPAPFGLEAGEMALAPDVDIAALDSDAMLWALANGVLKLQVDSAALRVFDQSTDERARYFLPLVSKAIKPRTTDTLKVMSPSKVKELR
ncbi:MAG: hypothetical protein IT367_20230 [Candidatus Hydrogenedentes bacterium]|nr:hypothetical protein [Candidatus Hydrogenedentota bacterium]